MHERLVRARVRLGSAVQALIGGSGRGGGDVVAGHGISVALKFITQS